MSEEDEEEESERKKDLFDFGSLQPLCTTRKI